MRKTIGAAVVIPQQPLSVLMIDQGDGSLCIPSVSDGLPRNLSRSTSLSSLVAFAS
jgi:hypothetical protein